jgi:ferredoxin
MTYVVTQHCVDCKYTDCVSVCPTDAFHEAERILYINPDTCVNCDACVPVCPVEAIYAEENLPSEYSEYLEMNIKNCVDLPVINTQKDALPGAKTLDELKELDKKGYKPPNFP